MSEFYTEHKGRAIEKDNRFKHVMALALDPTHHNRGIIRCITSREGDIHVKGYVDRSELYKVEGNSLEDFKITDKLRIKKDWEVTKLLTPPGWDFIGLEDPDIWIDLENRLTHVYFTIPILPPENSEEKIKVHLGHAMGKDLNSLEMTVPALLDNGKFRAKEVSIAPVNQKGFRYNLFESKDRQPDRTYSIVQVAIVKDMGEPWEYGEVVLHPKEQNIPWLGGHASPGPLLPKTFLNLGEGRLLGILNGREMDTKVGDQIKYGMFSVGLFIYDYENGKIEWVSPEPLIQDSEATTITFASQFVETEPGHGILYAHVDDSFVRAYTLYGEKIKALLPENFLKI